jgi:hypothetical protein
MAIDYPIYEDTVIAVKLLAENASKEQCGLFHLAIRYLKPQEVKDKSGNFSQTTNIMGGETDWFILPTSFGYAIAKSLIEQKVARLDCFYEDGFNRMIHWLIDMEEIKDCMEY